MPELLTDEEFLRYGRQILLPEIGEVGQARLKKQSTDRWAGRAGFSGFALSGRSRRRATLAG